MADAVWDGETPVTIESLLPGRVLRISSVATSPDSEAAALDYDIERRSRKGRRRASVHPAWAPGTGWWVSARDDVGTEYDAPGGVFGPSPSGVGMCGVLDIYPVPPAHARWLELTFYGAGRAAHRRFVLRVKLPLPILTDAEIARRAGMTETELLAILEMARRPCRSAGPETECETQRGTTWTWSSLRTRTVRE